MAYAPTPQRVRKPVQSYSAAHDLVKATKGRASEHACIECGEQAQQWALLPFYPGTVRMTHGPNEGKAFHSDPEAYQPMDRICHQRLDAAVRVSVKTSEVSA